MNKVKKYITRAGAVIAGVAAPVIALAQTAPTGQPQTFGGGYVNNIAGAAGIQRPDRPLEQIIGSIINIALGFLGVILLAYLLYAGFLWMTAGGETEKVEKAQTMIRNAIIGLVIILASFAISSFVLSKLATIAGGA